MPKQPNGTPGKKPPAPSVRYGPTEAANGKLMTSQPRHQYGAGRPQNVGWANDETQG
jgi:hypothetical protein